MIYLCRLFQDFIVLEDPVALPAISQTSSIIENKHLQFSIRRTSVCLQSLRCNRPEGATVLAGCT